MTLIINLVAFSVPAEVQNEIEDQAPENVEMIDFNDEKFKDEEEEELNLGVNNPQHEAQPEDEEFLRDLDRALTETFQAITACLN
jgi:uncharacterized protein YdhG (YjbR/CyaY superfamily)